MNPVVVKRQDATAAATQQVQLGEEPVTVGLLLIRAGHCTQRRDNQGQQVSF